MLRGDHGLAVDRGRIVREAVAVVLADLEAKGDEQHPRPPAARVVVSRSLGPVRPAPGRRRAGSCWMLRALGHPLAFLGLLVGFLLAVPVQAYVQARRAGVRRPAGVPAGVRRPADPARAATCAGYLDPYGAVAAVLAGVGWGARPDIQLRLARAGSRSRCWPGRSRSRCSARWP